MWPTEPRVDLVLWALLADPTLRTLLGSRRLVVRGRWHCFRRARRRQIERRSRRLTTRSTSLVFGRIVVFRRAGRVASDVSAVGTDRDAASAIVEATARRTCLACAAGKGAARPTTAACGTVVVRAVEVAFAVVAAATVPVRADAVALAVVSASHVTRTRLAVEVTRRARRAGALAVGARSSAVRVGCAVDVTGRRVTRETAG